MLCQYVDFELSQRTAAAIGGCQVWITNELPHSGLHDDGQRVFSHLQCLLFGDS